VPGAPGCELLEDVARDDVPAVLVPGEPVADWLD
jgi:hypothetical protein